MMSEVALDLCNVFANIYAMRTFANHFGVCEVFSTLSQYNSKWQQILVILWAWEKRNGDQATKSRLNGLLSRWNVSLPN